MKIALCLHGYYDNKSGDNLDNTNLIYKNIIKNNVDIFIHSFDYNNKERILKKYKNVKKYIIEKQIDFKNKINIEYINNIDKNIFPSPITENSILSFMYSRKKSIDMALEKDYDIIISSRFDNGIRLKKNTNKLNPTKLILPEYIDKKYLYMSNWEHEHSGYSDHWFFSNKENMKLIANMYNFLYFYFQPNSNFEFFCKNLEKKYNNYGFRLNSHTIHKFYLDKYNLSIKKLSFYGN